MEVLYADRELAVCVKPAGVDSEHQLPELLSQSLGGTFFTVHRLDMNVGGVMVFARTKPAAAALSKAIQEGAMVKEYVALVHGQPEETGDWTDLLFKDARKNKVFVVQRARAGVKEARLTYRRLFAGEDASLVRIRLYTGRSHQIRVQFSSRTFPLLGDHKYGARDALSQPMLYSCCLTFPWKGKTLRFEHLPGWADDARLRRIAAMEAAFDRRAPEDLPVLSAYMESGDWLRDYEADEAGMIPFALKRGVLSQDGLYNLLSGRQ